ncbi:LLM class flavin-dependent oxidoreductase [Micromonospora sp. WMMD961]|uniref:MupA/Atu3671 family FMN-dependent luciferase-like monooxygenase n=1 Tax=Micromonospora sp. WMMD961 TaxID=3016100 RepID=UPI002417B73E|nr:MupA/Atu3671 family FMN-dependent luciferase-like monooxygenase [Micromonospora sp. WMMD961]MDG4780097.1 LLM class flavin-dependent oxidoreductase [Micromonospora sp. WMMD961]
MDLSLFYFANDSCAADADRYEMLREGARFGDANGFSAVWMPERHFHPFGGIYPNPSVTAAAVAAITTRIGIRAGSVVAPLHHPLRIAEEWSVVDNLSGGRVGLSFASGWHARDFALRPENYDNRRQLMIDYLEQVRRLWRGEAITAPDGVGKEQELRIYPPPVQRELPVWVTSAGGVETFRAAGRSGAGLLTHLLGQSVPELADKIAAYRQAAAEHAEPGQRPGHVALMVHTFVGEREDEVRELVREPLTAYLRSSLGLVLGSQAGSARKIDPAKLRPSDLDFLIDRSFDRYVDDGGLLGAPEKARKVLDRLAEAGVDEVACLIDFGVPTPQVLKGLQYLGELCPYAAGLKSALR